MEPDRPGIARNRPFSPMEGRLPRRPARWGAAAAVVAMTGAAWGVAPETAPPWLTVPHTAAAPHIDGTVGEDEWRDAVSVEGLLSAFDGVAHPRQTAFRLMYDGEYLYIAQRSELLPGESPEFIWGRGPYHDHPQAGRATEDLVRIYISPAEDRVFRLLSNGLPPGREAGEKNTVWGDSVSLRGSPGSPDLTWDPDWRRAHRITPDGRFWESEFAVPLWSIRDYRTPKERASPPEAPGVDSPLADGSSVGLEDGLFDEFAQRLQGIEDGTVWRLNLARDYHGFDQALLAGTTLPALEQRAPLAGRDEYATVVFQSGAPAVQTFGLESLRRGRVVGTVRLRETGGRSGRTLTLTARVLDPDGGEVHAQRRTVTLPAGASAEVALDEVSVTEPGVRRLHLDVTDADGTRWFAQTVPFAAGGLPERAAWAPRLARFDLSQAPLRHTLDVTVAADEELGADDGRRATLVLRRRGESAPALTLPLPPFVKGLIEMRTDTAAVGPGRYAATVTVADGEGALLRQHTRLLYVPDLDYARDLPWFDTDAGVSDAVQPPWTPIQVERAGERVVVRCWGRNYTFAPGGLLEQIETAGLNLFAAPARFEGDGLEVKPLGGPDVLEETPARVVLRGTSELAAGAARATLTVTTELEYDGFAKMRIALDPATTLPLKSWRFVLPLASEHATHLHSTSADMRSSVWAGRLPAEPGVAWDSTRSVGRSPATLMTVGSFVPSIWIGRPPRGGLAFLADSDRGWAPHNETPAFQVIRRENERTDMIFNLVSAPFEVAAPREIVFALQATPVKPLPANFRRILTGIGNTYSFTGGPGVYSHLVPPYKGSFTHDTGWDGCWLPDGNMVASPFPADWELNLFFSQALDKAGNIYLPYQIMNYTHLTQPLDPRTKGLEGPELWHVIGPEIQCKGNGGWCMTPIHMQYRLYRYRDWIRHSRLRGLYFDNAYPISCANLDHGCGYRLDDGRVQPTFTMFNLREFFKRVRQLILDEGLDPVVMTHSTDTFMPAAYSFVDVMMDGETYRHDPPNEDPPRPKAIAADPSLEKQSDPIFDELVADMAAENKEGKDEPPTDPAPWRKYWSETWPLEHFQIFGAAQHWGIMTLTMALHPQAKQRPDHHGPSFLGYCLLHDVEYYMGAIRADVLRRAGLDLEKPMTFLPYWEESTRAMLKTDQPGVLLGGYLQDDLLLVVGFNRTRLPVEKALVTVHLKSLGWDAGGKSRVAPIVFPADAAHRTAALEALRERVLQTDAIPPDGRLTFPVSIEPHAFAPTTILRTAPAPERQAEP